MGHWIFVRHGQSVSNRERWYSGHTDVDLTRAGEAQACAAAEQLRDEPIRRVFASDLRRAWRTAELIVAGHALSVTRVPALRERHLGAWTGVRLSELTHAHQRVLLSFDARPPEGESLRDTARRAVAWFSEQTEDDCTLVVAHGGLLRAVLGLLDEVDTSLIPGRGVANAEVIRRDVSRARWGELLDLL